MDKYATVHLNENLKGPGDGRPSALQIIKDNDLEGKLSDKVMIITGCSSGIGIETARALSATGATLYLTVRDLDKAKAALEGILEPGRVEILHLDLNSLASVRKAAEEFLSKSKTLNVLINNAGIMATPEGKTEDGFETQFGTNHLAHFYLFSLVKDTLIASSTPSFHSRVVNVASVGHRHTPIHFDNFMMVGNYHPQNAYGQSKTANIQMANQIERLYGSQGLHGLSLHPGGIATGLQKTIDMSGIVTAYPWIQKTIKDVRQGAATTVWAAVGKVWEGSGGKYLEDCQVARPARAKYGPDEEGGYAGYAEWAYDRASEERLWEVSLSLVGMA
jgi:NAD(P)-dependent dehydrogenase (short-subunit alcohol dehydrogenase family)